MDGDGRHDVEAPEQVVEVKERGTPVEVELTGRELLLIQLAQVEKGEPARQNLPDLALTDGDVEVRPFEPRAGRTVTLLVTVHNIGSAPAEKVTVVLEEGDQRLDEEVIENLDAPNDLEPKVAELAIVWTPKLARTHNLKLVVDPENAIDEINGSNNTVELHLPVSP
jgi:subtilase family serine protease